MAVVLWEWEVYEENHCDCQTILNHWRGLVVTSYALMLYKLISLPTNQHNQTTISLSNQVLLHLYKSLMIKSTQNFTKSITHVSDIVGV